MKYIIDTHIFLWLLFTPDKIKKSKLEFMQNPKNELCVTSITFWEISLKFSLGKLELRGFVPEDLPQKAKQMGIEVIDIESSTMSSSYKLSQVSNHKDPFDRIIIWHCIQNRYCLISQDGKFINYHKHGLETR